MKYYKCKCGKCEYWGSDAPQECQGCRECNTTFAMYPEGHRVPISHDWVIETTIVEYQGKIKTENQKYCARCYTVEK